MEGARFSPVPTNANRYCCVYNCTSKACRSPDVRFHYFPRPGTLVSWTNKFGVVEKVDRRSLWIELLKMARDPSDHMRICSLHFRKEDYILPQISAKKRWLKSTANPSLNLPTVVRDKRASRYASYAKKEKRKTDRNDGDNNPRRKRKGAVDVDSSTSEPKLKKSNKISNRTAPIEEVLIKTEHTDEPIEEVFINHEHINEPVVEITVKEELIDEPVKEIVIKEECLDDYPHYSQEYKQIQIKIKTEEDEENYQAGDQSS